METATAQANLDIWVHCPHCTEFQDVTEQLRECLDDDLRASDIDQEITCSNPACEKEFIVVNITY